MGSKFSGSGFGAQLQAYRRVRAGMADTSPQGKELFRGYDYARLVQQSRGQSRVLKQRGQTDSQLLQSCRQPAGNPKVFAHVTMLSP